MRGGDDLPDGATAFDDLHRGHGSASRDPLRIQHGFQLKFKGDYGGFADYKLYTDSPISDFDDIILRPDFSSSWRH